jgi:hypothetical protein
MRCIVPFTALAVALAASTGRAEETTDSRFVTFGGSQVTGSVALKSIKVLSDLGLLEIPGSKVQSLTYSGQSDSNGRRLYQITTTGNDVVMGAIVSELPEIKTDLGTLKLDWAKLQSLSIIRKASTPAQAKEEATPSPK